MVPYGADTVMATGTGFLYEDEEEIYMITNGHNVTRVNPVTNERITTSMAFTDRIKFYVRRLITAPELAIGSEEVYTPLYADEDFKHPLWFVHPKFGYSVDVVAIPIVKKAEVPKGIQLYPINKFELDDNFYLEPSDDVFILGYPFAIDGDKKLPIWKRGSVATEPSIDIDGLPKILVDTASRPGMSGAPVFFQRSGIHGMKNGQLANDTIFGTIRGFVGIYSGRIAAPDPLDAQLGVVWKRTVIEDILSAKITGDIAFQSI
jgi:hypothetical protein